MEYGNRETWAMAAVAASGVAWGLFWIPLRATNEARFSAVWAVVLFYALPVAVLLPLYVLRWRKLVDGGWALHIAGILSGSSLVLYAGALLFTSVVNAMLLYYLTPIWSTLLARAILGETISLHRWITIGLGFLGLLIILGNGSGVPWPQNSGDWMGLSAGLVWAAASVQIRRHNRNHVTEYTLVYFMWGAAAAFALTLLSLEADRSGPSWAVLVDMLPFLVPVIILLVIPPAIAIFWGAKVLSPGLLGIIFMTEISVGAITAAIWANEPFGIRETLGVALITSAGLWEPVNKIVRRAA